MAVSSTSSSSSVGTSAIDVAAVVQQLMTLENRPLEAINAKITRQSTIISDLGILKSKVSSFSDALAAFENPYSYNDRTVSTSNSSYIQASSTNGTQLGNYEISVSDIASPSRYAFVGFSSDDDAVTNLTGFTIKVGSGTTYTAADISADIGNTPTITELADWINALGENVAANVVLQKTESNGDETWALTIQSTEMGEENAVVLGTTTGIATIGNTIEDEARNAVFTFNGIEFERASNTVSDIIEGLTIELIDITPDESPVNLRVKEGSDTSSTVIQNLITSYNELMAYYKSLTAYSSTGSSTTSTATFASDPTSLSFISEIKSKFAQGVSYGSDYAGEFSLSWAGIDMELDGTLSFNQTSYDEAVGEGLLAKLQEGVTVAYSDSSDSLATYLDSYAGANGYIEDLILSKAQQAYDLSDQQAQIQTRLNKIEENLYMQYSALNALLFQLSSTSNSLTSALDALTNSQRNN